MNMAVIPLPWFKAFTNQRDVTKRAPLESVGRAYVAMLDYAVEEKDPDFGEDFIADMLFTGMKQYIDKSRKDYMQTLAASEKGGKANQERIERERIARERLGMDAEEPEAIPREPEAIPRKPEAIPNEPEQAGRSRGIAETETDKKAETSVSLLVGCEEPTLEEVVSFAVDAHLKIDPYKFYEVMEERGWKDAKGNPVRNWKKLMLAYDRYAQETQTPAKKPPKRNARPAEQHDYDFDEIDRMLLEKQKNGIVGPVGNIPAEA